MPRRVETEIVKEATGKMLKTSISFISESSVDDQPQGNYSVQTQPWVFTVLSRVTLQKHMREYFLHLPMHDKFRQRSPGRLKKHLS